MIKTAVVGALGKMGQEVVKTVIADNDTELVAAIDRNNLGQSVYGSVAIEGDIKQAFEIAKPNVVIDFTQPAAVFEHAELYINMGIKGVIGTTGLSSAQINELKKLSKEKNTGCIIAPNFSLGAVLMMMFAAQAAKYFNNAEIIEFHHNQKKDAPSGTAIKTAQLMADANSDFKQGNCVEVETIKGSRGGVFLENEKGNINIHSVRMPGFVASQEVIFGSDGQTLKIRHDSIDRKCYMSGILLAVKHVYKNNEFIYGLENIL